MDSHCSSKQTGHLAAFLLQHALEASKSQDLEAQIEPLLMKWEEHRECSFATAFRFRRSTGEVKCYNPLPLSTKQDSRTAYTSFCYLIKPTDLPHGARLPWDILRARAKDERDVLFAPHVLLQEGHTTSTIDNQLTHHHTVLRRLSETELDEFAENPSQKVADQFNQSDAYDANSFICFAVAPAKLAERFRNTEGDRRSTIESLVYIMGTRKHFSDIDSEFDYGLVLGLSESTLESGIEFNRIVNALWTAWNVIAVPIYLQDRENRLAGFAIGRTIVHAMKNHLHKEVFEELDSLVAKGELSIVVASTLKLTLDRYPAFFSFVARKPCADNSDETIRPEDTDPDPYDPVFVISDLLFSEISKNRGASETKFKFITRDYPDETADRKITFIRKDFLRIFIAEIVGNAIDHGDTAKGISVKSSVDDKMQMQLTVENSPKYLQPNANLIPKPGRGLSSIREFCSALGGNALFNHKDGKFAINISLPLSRIAMRFLNKDS